MSLDITLEEKVALIKEERKELPLIVKEGQKIRQLLYNELLENNELLEEQLQKSFPLVEETIKNIKRYEMVLLNLSEEIVIKNAGIEELVIEKYLFIWENYSDEKKVREISLCNKVLLKLTLFKIAERLLISQLSDLKNELREELPLYEKMLCLYQASIVLNRTIDQIMKAS